MVPYYKELEKDFYLPIINKRKINNNLDNKTITNDFYSKYNPLFDLITNLNSVLNKLEITNLNCDNNILVKLKNNITYLSEINIKTISNFNTPELEKYLLTWGEIFDLLYNLGLYQTDFDNYIKLMQLFNSSLIEIARIRGKLVEIKLPSTWLITSRGYLYNTGSSNHVGADYSEYYRSLNEKFLTDQLDFKVNKENNNQLPEISNPSIITNNGYVRETILDLYLEYFDYILFNKKSFDPKYIKIITGMLEIKQDYYKFLRKLNLYTDKPKEELEKIIAKTKDNYDDVLVRCCGVAKVCNLSFNKTIVTSTLNHDYDFQKYVVNGWKVNFYPPLIINKEKGIVEEYSDNFLKIREFRKYY